MRLLMLLVLLLACSRANAEAVSMVKVIYDPSPYVGKKVTLRGWLKIGALPRLFLTKEHSDMGDILSAVSLSGAIEESTYISILGCKDRHVRIRGILGTDNGRPTIDDLEEVWAFEDGLCWGVEK